MFFLIYNKKIKPVLKWVGGKRQLLNEIRNYYPFNTGVTKYAEPFIGGGAVLFDILNNYDLKECYINDINRDLINFYKVLKDDVFSLIEELYMIKNDYEKLIDIKSRKGYYNKMRFEYNSFFFEDCNIIRRAAIFLFLNKICFNGLYRVNKNGLFNTPVGKCKTNFLNFDFDNIFLVSEKLKNVNIMNGQYSILEDFVDDCTFVYLDPPYRKLPGKSNFIQYSEFVFSDYDQVELSLFFKRLDKKGAKLLMSNSDPKNTDDTDSFFDNLYGGYNIKRVYTHRLISSINSVRNNKVSEILVSNF